MNLKELNETIKKEQETIARLDKDINEGNLLHVIRTKSGQLSQAKLRLEQARQQYVDELRSGALLMVAVSEDSEKLNKFNELSNSYGCFTADAEILYKEVLKNIPGRLVEGQTTTGILFDHVNNFLEDRAREIGISSFVPVTFHSKYKRTLKSKEDALEVIKRAINDSVGGEFVVIDTISRLLPLAIEAEWDNKTFPIVLTTKDSVLASELVGDAKTRLGMPAFVVSIGDEELSNSVNVKEVSETSVKDALVTIRTLSKKGVA